MFPFRVRISHFSRALAPYACGRYFCEVNAQNNKPYSHYEKTLSNTFS